MLAFALLLGCPEPSTPAPAPLPATPSPSEAPERVELPAELPTPADQPSTEDCTPVPPPPGLVDLRATLPTAIFVVGYHHADNFTGAPLPGYEAPGAWLETEAAAALAKAAARLERDGLRLIIHDAYRPRRATQAMVAWCRANDREDLLSEGWVAERSAHNRGRAIDLSLADGQGRALDMGSGWDEFSPRSEVYAVDGEARERRLQLRAAMVHAGFTPYAREWWHFGYESDSPAPARDLPYVCQSQPLP